MNMLQVNMQELPAASARDTNGYIPAPNYLAKDMSPATRGASVGQRTCYQTPAAPS